MKAHIECIKFIEDELKGVHENKIWIAQILATSLFEIDRIARINKIPIDKIKIKHITDYLKNI